MTEKRILVRLVYYPEGHLPTESAEAVEVEITWPNGEPPRSGDARSTCWMLAEKGEQ